MDADDVLLEFAIRARTEPELISRLLALAASCKQRQSQQQRPQGACLSDPISSDELAHAFPAVVLAAPVNMAPCLILFLTKLHWLMAFILCSIIPTSSSIRENGSA